MNSLDCIEIEGLTVETVIGCLTWERQIKQPLVLDLRIYCDLTKASQSDQLADTLNYADLCQITTQAIQHAQPALIEHAGFIILNTLFDYDSRIEKINVRIAKPAIIAQAQTVAIRLERHRHDFCHRSVE